MNDPWTDRTDLNRLESGLCAYARELYQIGYSDPQEAIAKMHGAVSLLGEHMTKVLRREREEADRQAEHPRECIPPVEVA